MYKISKEISFSAAHRLRGYEGKCEKIHGHNWKVRVYVESKNLNNIGIVLDFKELKRILKKAVERFDHQDLNEVPPFDKINPSSENLARIIFEKVSPPINNKGVEVSEVRVWENEASSASYKR